MTHPRHGGALEVPPMSDLPEALRVLVYRWEHEMSPRTRQALIRRAPLFVYAIQRLSVFAPPAGLYADRLDAWCAGQPVASVIGPLPATVVIDRMSREIADLRRQVEELTNAHQP